MKYAGRPKLGMRSTLTISLLLSVLAAGTSSAQGRPAGRVNLGSDRIGGVRFGVPKEKAVASLRALFGAPGAQGINTACGPRYTEVEWGDLVAEFRSNKFSGYRFLKGGYPLHTVGSPREPRPKTVFPKLATSEGITLGSTLARLRSADKVLRSVGTDKWQSGSGLIFVDNAKHDPEPPSSQIVEIKTGTCGDF